MDNFKAQIKNRVVHKNALTKMTCIKRSSIAVDRAAYLLCIQPGTLL